MMNIILKKGQNSFPEILMMNQPKSKEDNLKKRKKKRNKSKKEKKKRSFQILKKKDKD